LTYLKEKDEMNQHQLLKDVESLPPAAQQEAIDFIAFLKNRYAKRSVKTPAAANLQDHNFVGMWKDRDDLSDSVAWVRQLRQNDWR
jgi:hypothetical protein